MSSPTDPSSQRLHANVPLPEQSEGSKLTVLSNTMYALNTPEAHPYAQTNHTPIRTIHTSGINASSINESTQIRTTVVNNGSLSGTKPSEPASTVSRTTSSSVYTQQRLQPASSPVLLRSPAPTATTPTPPAPVAAAVNMGPPKKSQESTKSQKIKEYLGIAANISDWDFEALQNDIKALGESLSIDSYSDPVPSGAGPLSATTPTVHVALPNSLRLPTLSETDSSSSRPHEEAHSPLPSDTESEEENCPILNLEDENDAEAKILRTLEHDTFAVSWRWSWLQLQYQEVQRNLAHCTRQVQTMRRQKPSCVPILAHPAAPSPPSLADSSARCLGWSRLSDNRPLVPPPAQILHFRLGKTFHPLFSESPRVIVRPKTNRKQSSDRESSSSRSRSRSTASSNRSQSRWERDRLRRERNRKNASTTTSPVRKKTRRTADFDINNVVLPQMGGTVQKIRTIEYKEILTPPFRPSNDDLTGLDEGSSSENTDDEVYAMRHEPKEKDEQARFAIPEPQLKKIEKMREKRRRSMRQSAPATLSSSPADETGSRSARKRSKGDDENAGSASKRSRKSTSSKKSRSTKKGSSKKKTERRKSSTVLSASTSGVEHSPPPSPVVAPHRYPDDSFVSTVSLSANSSQPSAHSHNTRRSARVSARRVSQDEEAEDSQADDSSTKIILRPLSFDDDNTSLDMSTDDEEDDRSSEETDPGSPSPPQSSPVPATDIPSSASVGKKRRKGTPRQWIASKRVAVHADNRSSVG